MVFLVVFLREGSAGNGPKAYENEVARQRGFRCESGAGEEYAHMVYLGHIFILCQITDNFRLYTYKNLFELINPIFQAENNGKDRFKIHWKLKKLYEKN